METDLITEPPIDPLGSISTYATSTSGFFGLPAWIGWVLIIVVLLFCGFFSASETAFCLCNKYHFRRLAEEGNRTAKIITRLINKYDRTIVTVLVANNGLQTLMSFVCAMLFYGLIGNETVEAIVGTIVMAVIVFVITDTLPKIIANKIPNKLVVILAWPDWIFTWLIWPIAWIFRSVLLAFQKIFKIKDESILSKEDFMERADEATTDETTVDSSSEELFEDKEVDLLEKTFTFDTIPASSVLTPLEKMVAIDLKDLNAKYVNKFILNSNYSRFPVYEGETNNIVGILTINSYFKEYSQDPHLDLRSVLNSPIYVYDDMKMDEILDILNDEQIHLAIVKNRNEEVIGMITLEDVLDELVGENSLKSWEGEKV